MSRTLLVLDDSQTIQEAVRNALAGEDWEVIAVSTVDEAVQAVASRRPDAVLCDVAPGEEDGYEACRRLREAAGGAGIPVILMGARVGDGPARSAGATAVLSKPFSSDELLSVLQEALEAESFALALDSMELEEAPEQAAPAGADAGEAGDDEEEIEVIDLSDEDAFADLELLDDLEPIEPAPAEVEAPAPAPELPPSDPETDVPIELSGELDLGSIDLALEELPGEEPPEPAGAEEGVAPETGAGDEPAAYAGTPAGVAPTGEDVTDLSFDAPGPAPGEEMEGTGLAGDAQPPGTEESGASEIEGILAGLGPEAETPAIQEARDAEGAVREQGPELLEPESTPEAGLQETPESYLEEASEWAASGPTPPHTSDWDRSPDVAVGMAAPPDLGQTVERTVREALEQSLSPEVLTPLVQAAVERVVWEVVPQIAERMIQEAIERIQKEPPPPPA